MSDRMEDFFKQNRQEFDAEEPGSHIWFQIKQRLTRRNSYQMVWKVAAVFFLFTTIYLLIDRSSQVKGFTQDLEAQSAFVKIENYYSNQISIRESWIRESTIIPEVDLRNEYDRLLAMYEVLKIQWEQHPTEELKDALILNLIVRLDLMTKQMDGGRRQISWRQ